MSLNKLLSIFIELAILSMVIIYVANVQYDNGKLDMCKELGGNLSYPGKICYDAGLIDEYVSMKENPYNIQHFETNLTVMT